jgi:F-type H+-transporting ATPase subunit gamma
MQMVAAAKLRRAQDAAEASRPYAQALMGMLSNLCASLDSGQKMAFPLIQGTGQDKIHLLVVMTSERGLCGGFNTTIVRLVREKVEALKKAGKTIKILCIGKKGWEVLKRLYPDLILDRLDFSSIKRIGYDHAVGVSQSILKYFDQNAFDVCTLFYSQFKSAISQIPQAQQIIPLPEIPQSSVKQNTVYEFEPSSEVLLGDLLPRNLAIQVYSALLENAASEQGARMGAMDSATRNAGQMINRLTLQYNRTRQANITKELIEIISGAEAL